MTKPQVHKRIIPEDRITGKPLGRHVKHDERSKAYPMSHLVHPSAPLVTKAWKRETPAFNQGDIGSCTGNALTGLLMTDPFFVAGRVLDETTAVALYSMATQLDPQDGQSYPPNDTGSSGVDICKAAEKAGYITNYHHGFVTKTVQQYLSNEGPVILGINWYDSMDEPDKNNICHITAGAKVRGGHEIEIAEIDMEKSLYGIWNSWGTDWAENGKFYVTFDDMDRLLSEGGDVTAAVTPSIA